MSGRSARVARVHQAAGVVLGVGEQRRHLACASARRAAPSSAVALLGGRLLDHVGGVVGRQEAHPRAALGGAAREEQLGLIARVQAEEEVLGLGVRQEAEALEPLLGGEDRPGVAQLGAAETRLACSLLGRSRHDAVNLLLPPGPGRTEPRPRQGRSTRREDGFGRRYSYRGVPSATPQPRPAWGAKPWAEGRRPRKRLNAGQGGAMRHPSWPR